MSVETNETELSPEMQSIKFEWTPQLREIFARGLQIHPYIGPGYEKGKHSFQHYKAGMPLPDPANPTMFLQWCGLRDETIREVINKFYEENKDLVAQTPKCGYITKLVPAGFYDIYYPVLDGLVHTYSYMLGYGKRFDFDYEESYEGFVKKAIQRGLKPEFAIFCGFHEDDPRAKEKPDWFLARDPMSYAHDLVLEVAQKLRRLIKEKLVYDGKVTLDKEKGYAIAEEQQQKQETQEQGQPEAPKGDNTENEAAEQEG